MMPGYTTIIIPIEEQRADDCRRYLRDNVEPSSTSAGLRCSRKFPFNLIPTLHFCSFIVLHEDDFGPNLVFEATFDGSRDDFLSDLLRVAPDGMHELFSHCVGYPCSDSAIPHIAREYLVRHDAGAHTFFCGSPGRTSHKSRTKKGSAQRSFNIFRNRELEAPLRRDSILCLRSCRASSAARRPIVGLNSRRLSRGKLDFAQLSLSQRRLPS